MLSAHSRAFEAAREEFLAYLSTRTWSKSEPMGCAMIAIVPSDERETILESFDIHEEQWPSGRHYDDMARRKLVPAIREGMDLHVLLTHYPWKLREGEARTAGAIRATDENDSEQVWVAFSGLDPMTENVPLARRLGALYLRHLRETE